MVNNSKEILNQKLASTIEECDKHIKWLLSSHHKIQHLFPLTSQTYHDLDEEIIPMIDQFVYRFTKLQDTMGTRLFSAILLVLAEDPKNLSFIDILNRLEQLNIISSKDTWLDLRNLRNLAAHEYGDAQNADILNKLFNSLNIIEDIYYQAKAYINQNKIS